MNMISQLNKGVADTRASFNAPAQAGVVSVASFEKDQVADFLNMLANTSDLSHQTLFDLQWQETGNGASATIALANKDKAKNAAPLTIHFPETENTNVRLDEIVQADVQSNAALAQVVYWAGQTAPSCYEALCKTVHAFQDDYLQRQTEPDQSVLAL